jgi:cytochrome c
MTMNTVDVMTRGVIGLAPDGSASVVANGAAQIDKSVLVANLDRTARCPGRGRTINRGVFTLALIAMSNIAAGSSSLAADPRKGAQLAQQWCASCHMIGGAPPRTALPGPPSFRAVARGVLAADQLQAFLTRPHGSMPDLSLTRSEMDDLIAYIGTLR